MIQEGGRVKSRVVEKDGASYCIPCAGGSFSEMNGAGIVARG
jgi:hypothetical protein